jgi:hypothetical protein
VKRHSIVASAFGGEYLHNFTQYVLQGFAAPLLDGFFIHARIVGIFKLIEVVLVVA